MNKVTAVAPINIALIKYWGKQDVTKVIPYTDSISLTLDALYTTTTIMKHDDAFTFILNGEQAGKKETARVYQFLSLFPGFQNGKNILVESFNSGPTAAGLASSASGFAALSLAANTFFKTNYSIEELANITKLGSGSACRSLLGGFVHWNRNESIKEIPYAMEDLRMIFVIIEDNQKDISSKEAMQRTVETSSLYPAWVQRQNEATKEMLQAIKEDNFQKIGELTEESALGMHATMLASNPPILYMQSKSILIYSLLKELRHKNIAAYATMDAGPNVKILTKKQNVNSVIEKLKEAGYLNVITSKISKGAEIIESK